MGKRKNVTIQVLPFSAGVLAGYTSGSSSLSFAEEPTVEAVTRPTTIGGVGAGRECEAHPGHTAELEGSRIVTGAVGPFRKSSYSGQENNCVEVAPAAGLGRVVRDSKWPSGPLLAVSGESWRRFLRGL